MWRVIALGLALAFPTTAAHADAVVTLCNSGNQTGAGTNLVSALATGGRITFACGSSATILMSCQHQIVANTEIDGGGTVTLQDDPSACLIPRTQGLFNHNSAQPFSFQLTSLRIVGVKPPPQTPAGQLRGQLVSGNFELTVANSTITGWTSPIGLTAGQAILDNSTLSDNDGVVVGAPNLTIRNHSVFANNEGPPLEAQGGAVAIADSQFTGNKRGSNLKQCATIDVRNSRFDSNSDPFTGGALTAGCDTRISNTAFTNNQALSGGALYIGDGAAHTNLVGVTFESNTATADGGAISIRFEIFAPVPPAQTVELHGVTFKANQAQIAGGLDFARGALAGVALAQRTLSAAGTQFIDNHASLFGGGLVLARAQAAFDGVLFIGNKADQSGGGMVVLEDGDGRLTLANSLLAKNVAPFGAAIAGQAVALVNSTVADNDGPGISAAQTVSPFPVLGGPAGPQPIEFQNTIIAGGSGAPCGPPDAAAPYVDLGHNLQSNGNGCGGGILVGAPLFGPSYIPLPTSPAAHGGDDGVCAAAPIAGRDIWDKVRPYSGHCAIGASESNIQQIINQAGGSLVDLLRCPCLRWWK